MRKYSYTVASPWVFAARRLPCPASWPCSGGLLAYCTWCTYKYIVYMQLYGVPVPEYQLQCAAQSINSSVPPRVSTPVCHQEYQLQCATKSINSSVPPRVSTPVCHQEYQLQCATKSINSSVPPRVSTPVCHQEYQLQSICKTVRRKEPPSFLQIRQLITVLQFTLDVRWNQTDCSKHWAFSMISLCHPVVCRFTLLHKREYWGALLWLLRACVRACMRHASFHLEATLHNQVSYKKSKLIYYCYYYYYNKHLLSTVSPGQARSYFIGAYNHCKSIWKLILHNIVKVYAIM